MAPPQTSFAQASALPLPIPAPAPAPPRRDVAAIIDDLHARHGEELLRFCRWTLKDADDAADALQDTWIRAMSALGESRVAVTALRPWLYAIARNVCMDKLRERKRASLHDLDDDCGGQTPGADEVVALRQEAGAALALVGALSERQRSALLMRELAGMSIPEIGKALGLTPDRAAWAIGDARRALEEARAGVTLACEDARVRLASGHRGRTLRAHLGQCTACLAHDRRLRARRVLAPALVPFLWLRRLATPLFANHATAATMAVVLTGTGTGTWVGKPQPQMRTQTPVHRAAEARTVERPAARPDVQVRASRVRPAPALAGAVPEQQRAVVTAPPARATVIRPASKPEAPAAPSAPAPAAPPTIVETAVAPVRDVVATVTESAGTASPAAAPLIDDVAAVADGVIDGLR